MYVCLCVCVRTRALTYANAELAFASQLIEKSLKGWFIYCTQQLIYLDSQDAYLMFILQLSIYPMFGGYQFMYGFNLSCSMSVDIQLQYLRASGFFGYILEDKIFFYSLL